MNYLGAELAVYANSRTAKSKILVLDIDIDI